MATFLKFSSCFRVLNRLRSINLDPNSLKPRLLLGGIDSWNITKSWGGEIPVAAYACVIYMPSAGRWRLGEYSREGMQDSRDVNTEK